jgi:FkbM family methyltransferase
MLIPLFSLIRNRWHPLWRLRQLPAYRLFQQRYDRTVFTRIPETGIHVAVKGLRDASWIGCPTKLEPEVKSAFVLVFELLKPPVFWDIGANIGFYSWFARQYPQVEQVVMFEPDPTNFALITNTIRRNSILDCHPMNLALSDRCGQTTFLLDQASGATGTLEVTSQREIEHSLHKAYDMKETITIETATIDSLIADGLPAPKLIKIDVEGAEHLVLAGAESCLTSSEPVLIVETTNTDLVHRLRDFGYKAYCIDASNILFVPDAAGVNWGPFMDNFPAYEYLA